MMALLKDQIKALLALEAQQGNPPITAMALDEPDPKVLADWKKYSMVRFQVDDAAMQSLNRSFADVAIEIQKAGLLIASEFWGLDKLINGFGTALNHSRESRGDFHNDDE